MIIDFHTHAFPDALAPRAIASLVKACGGVYTPCTDGSVSGLVKAMDLFGVDISVVQAVVTKPSQTESICRFAAEIECGRIIAFGGIHPDTDDYKRDIDLICSLGLKGIKLHPEYQQFYIDSPEIMRMYDYALSKGLVLLFHAGLDPAYEGVHSSPATFAKVARELGGGDIVLAHLGGSRQWDEVEEHLCGTAVYMDTSMGFAYYGKERFIRIVRSHGADRLLFGSDSPWSRADEEISVIRSLPLTEREKELILGGNAQRLLGISTVNNNGKRQE